MNKMLITEIWTIAQTNHGCVVFLRPVDSEVAVPLIIGQLELQSIIIGKEGVEMPRPLTHDLILNVLKSLDLTLRQVEIHSLVAETFHARLVLEGTDHSESPLSLDSRPSDAIALAVRAKCPIYISAAVVKKTGIPLDYFLEEIDKAGLSPDDEGEFNESAHFHGLIRQLNQAIEAEEYEKAAEIRDMLIKIEKLNR